MPFFTGPLGFHQSVSTIRMSGSVQISAVLQEGRHEGRAIIEPSSAGTFFSIFAITSSLSARIDSTFRAIETHFTPYFSKRNRLRCFTQAGYCFRKVNQFLEITHDQRADKFRCTDAVLLGQNLHSDPELLWNFDQRAMWFWIKFVLSGTLATQECRVY